MVPTSPTTTASPSTTAYGGVAGFAGSTAHPSPLQPSFGAPPKCSPLNPSPSSYAASPCGAQYGASSYASPSCSSCSLRRGPSSERLSATAARRSFQALGAHYDAPCTCSCDGGSPCVNGRAGGGSYSHLQHVSGYGDLALHGRSPLSCGARESPPPTPNPMNTRPEPKRRGEPKRRRSGEIPEVAPADVLHRASSMIAGKLVADAAKAAVAQAVGHSIGGGGLCSPSASRSRSRIAATAKLCALGALLLSLGHLGNASGMVPHEWQQRWQQLLPPRTGVVAGVDGGARPFRSVVERLPNLEADPTMEADRAQDVGPLTAAQGVPQEQVAALEAEYERYKLTKAAERAAEVEQQQQQQQPPMAVTS